jgi:hypothetical protein
MGIGLAAKTVKPGRFSAFWKQNGRNTSGFHRLRYWKPGSSRPVLIAADAPCSFTKEYPGADKEMMSKGLRKTCLQAFRL